MFFKHSYTKVVNNIFCFVYRLGARRCSDEVVGIEEDGGGFGDGSGLVEVHQLVEGRESLGPQEIVTSLVADDLEVLHVALVPASGSNFSHKLKVNRKDVLKPALA